MQRAVVPSLRRVVRVAQRVLRPELWGSYEVTESGDFVSVRVHRVQDGTKTVSVPISRGSSDARGKAPPSTTPTKWKDMSKKERRSTQAQRRGILNRFARTGVLADSHPARKWVRLAKAAAERCNLSVSSAQPRCGMWWCAHDGRHRRDLRGADPRGAAPRPAQGGRREAVSRGNGHHGSGPGLIWGIRRKRCPFRRALPATSP